MNLKKTIIVAALAPFAMTSAASAQETGQAPAATVTPAATPASFQDWELFCSEPKAASGTRICEIRTVMTGKDGQKLGALVVAAITQAKTKNSEVIASALMPLGVDLTTNPALKIDDGNPVALKFMRCLQRGCEAMAPLSAKQQASMAAGSKAKLAVGIGGGKHAVFEFSLNGFTAALAAMKERTGAK